ncbi:MAG: hypothetical protein K8F60_14195 [Melioribacteraceae bacterium]|jgi:hypothetical protein|nr:hypothetical protein [Ignavibacteriota bacterium]MBZ0183605.1 hypothetical protein [Melioribacteraceae bacterium]
MKKIILFFAAATFLFAQSNQIFQLEQNIDVQLENNQVNLLEQPSGKKNAGLAILYSLILPGMGELYAENYESGKYFTIADGVIWGFVAGFNIYGNRQENNYKAFAESYGGVDNSGKDADFYANVANYTSVDLYNREQELNRNFEGVYNTQTHYWKWAGTDQRREFRELWSSSETAYNNVRFAVGALILNRVISIINAVRSVSKYNANLENQQSWNLSFDVSNKLNLPTTLNLNFSTRF